MVGGCKTRCVQIVAELRLEIGSNTGGVAWEGRQDLLSVLLRSWEFVLAKWMEEIQ